MYLAGCDDTIQVNSLIAALTGTLGFASRNLSRMPKQPNTKRDHRKGENHCSGVDQGDGSAGLSSSWRQHREEESEEMRMAESGIPIRTAQSSGLGKTAAAAS